MVSTMGGRRDDSAPGRDPLPPVPPRPAASRPPARAAERPVPPVIHEPPSAGRRGWLVVGLVLAAGATIAVFFAENPLYLRIALLAVCWAFVVAAFLAGNRRADQAAAVAREAELRHAYDLELEREVAARHEYEVQLEGRLRREAEDAMRTELTQLRTELAGLSTLRDDLAGLGQLRTELAALTEIRGELAALGELRTDLGRMRSELTEQLSGELFIERMVMRAQSVRGPAQSAPGPADGRTLEGTPSWASPSQPLAGGWDVEHREETRVVPAEPVEPAPRPIAGPPPVPPSRTRTAPTVDEESAARHLPPSPIEWLIEESVLEPWVEPRPRSPLEWLGEQSLLDENGEPTGEIPVAVQPEPAPRRHHRAAEPDDEESVTGAAWSAAPSYDRPSYDSASYDSTAPDSPAYVSPSYEKAPNETSSYGSSSYAGDPTPGSSYDSSGYDEMLFGSSTYTSPSASGSPSYGSPSLWETPSYESPSSGSSSSRTSPEEPASGSTSGNASGYTSSGHASAADEPARHSRPESPGHARLEQILAESGVEAPSGGRSRRRRYRDEDGETAGDDVLARVLGRN
jgi:hypothetical protein